jgi:lipopolysaccharide/colanic/teichoic acid biosynthesis glycosyltransferase
VIKRLFDLITSTIALVLLSPLLVVIGVLVKRDSPGPALFKQERSGRGGEPFTLLKFRSMTAAPTEGDPLITAATDARITKVGARLRSTKLDELPQLVNVVRGDMSIVGPRPEVAKYVAMWPEEDREIILTVRPGITDPATLQLRNEELVLAGQSDPEAYYRDVLLPEKVRLYRRYVETRTFAGDIRLILKTVAAVVAK